MFPVAGVRTVAANGASLAYLERGSGPGVVFVHGALSDLRTWLPQMDAFAARYRAIAYSRRYARPNEDIPDGQDDQMLPHVDDLVALVRALGLAPVHLVGNSWGAFICLLAAQHAPELVRSLTLCEPPVIPLFVSLPPKPAELLRLCARDPRDLFAFLSFGGRVMEPATKAFAAGNADAAIRTFATGVLGTQAFVAIPEERRDQMRENCRALAAQLQGAGFPPLTDADVRSVRTPTLLVVGQKSPALFRRTFTGRLRKLMPHAELADIPASTHVMHEQNPDAFNAAVLAFLAQQDRSPMPA